MVQHQQRPIQFDLVHHDIRQGRGQNGSSIRLLADVADMFLDAFAVHPAVLDLCQVGFTILADFADEGKIKVSPSSHHY
jgi:hypothetical protein